MNSEAISRAGLRKYLRRSRSTIAQVGSRRVGNIARLAFLEKAHVEAQRSGRVAQIAAGEVDEDVLEGGSPERERGDGDALLARGLHQSGQRAVAVAALDEAGPVVELDG